MLHHYAKRFFAPNLISPYLDGNTFKVYMVVDKLPADLGERSGPVQTKATFSRWQIGDKMGYQVHHSVVQMDQPVDFSPQGEDTLYIRMMSWGSLTPLYTWKQSFTVSLHTTAFPYGTLLQEHFILCLSLGGCVCLFVGSIVAAKLSISS